MSIWIIGFYSKQVHHRWYIYNSLFLFTKMQMPHHDSSFVSHMNTKITKRTFSKLHISFLWNIHNLLKMLRLNKWKQPTAETTKSALVVRRKTSLDLKCHDNSRRETTTLLDTSPLLRVLKPDQLRPTSREQLFRALFVIVEVCRLGIQWPTAQLNSNYDDVIKWKLVPRYWLFVRGIHRSPVSSPHKGQWRGAVISSLIWARTNGWVNSETLVLWDAIVLIMTSL